MTRPFLDGKEPTELIDIFMRKKDIVHSNGGIGMRFNRQIKFTALVVLMVLFPVVVFDTENVLARSYIAYDAEYPNFNTEYSEGKTPEENIVNFALAQEGRKKAELGYKVDWCAYFIEDIARYLGYSDAIPSNYSYAEDLYYKVLETGTMISDESKMEKGDLVFYCYTPGISQHEINHVGMIVDSEQKLTIHGNLKKYKHEDEGWQVVKLNIDDIRGTDENPAWKKIIVRPNYSKNYRVTYDANGGTGSTVDANSYEKGSEYKIMKNSFKRTGYTFVGWNTAADGSGTSYKAGTKIDSGFNSDITLYAQWKGIPYTIKYMDGKKKLGTQKREYGDNKSLLSFVNTGYYIASWKPRDGKKTYNAGAVIDFVPSEANETLILNVTWKKILYTVSFDGNGATSGKTETLALRWGEQDKLTKNGYERAGFEFVGWNTKADGTGKSYSNCEKVKNLSSTNKENIILYAQWKKCSYKITYKLDGGTNNDSNPSNYTSTTATITLASPSKKGYTFKGWYSDSSLKNKVTKIKKGSTGNRTVYAKWKANQYTIIFDGNGATSGNMSAMSGCKYGSSYTLNSNDFKKKNRTFTGWNTKADGSGISYSDGASVKNLSSKANDTATLYAQWEKEFIAYKSHGTILNSTEYLLPKKQSKILYDCFGISGYDSKMSVAVINKKSTLDFSFSDAGIKQKDIIGVVIGWIYLDNDADNGTYLNGEWCDADYIASFESPNKYEHGWFGLNDRGKIPARWGCGCHNSAYTIDTIDKIYDEGIQLSNYVLKSDNDVYFATVVYSDYSFTVYPFIYPDKVKTK